MIVLIIVVIALTGAITSLIQANQELRYEERRTEMIKQLQTKKPRLQPRLKMSSLNYSFST